MKAEFQPGAKNAITDVAGVRVGHATLSLGDVQTGVTVVVPCAEVFRKKLAAAVCVLNGFGKSAGLVQVEELGTLESPIALTNTLAVGACWQAVCRGLIQRNPDLKSVNPLVMECNDSTLNDIRSLPVTETMVDEAWGKASDRFALGAVGAGRGMVCHGLKGGIGTASCMTEIAGKACTLGALVLTNHGKLGDLIIHGDPVGERLAEKIEGAKPSDTGSCIVILATDIPMSPLLMKRACRRVGTGLARVGNHVGHGSGEIALMFSTAPRCGANEAFPAHTELSDAYADLVFRMAIQATEEAVLSSLWNAETVTGFQGKTVKSLTDCLKEHGESGNQNG